ncbi:MAG: glycosyl hydrolase [Thermoguttaceae bacterium]|jgi:hypothetical protein
MKRMVLAALVVASLASVACAAEDLARGFAWPPQSARPWVYWFPLSGNLSKQGITADLEALQRVGIGGVLYMEVDQGAPKGPADFAGPLWRELFQHACKEAHRLGLEINMNNDAGWCGSGGPWISPELSMQRVVWTETVVRGPKSFDGTLARPQAVRNFYQDIAVLAMPAPEGQARIQGIQGKSSAIPQHFPPQRAAFATLPAESVIPRNGIVNLTGKMDAAGKLVWDVPQGQWLVLRLGHTSTGKDNHPAPASGCGLECDKLSKEATESHFNGLMGRLIADNRALAGKDKVLVSTHIDSWEVGSQNWTPRMRQEFQQRCGYDLLPLLPTFTGRVVDSLEVSERFLWDLRQTVSDMLIENYAGHFRALANRHGLRLSIEAYDGVPCDEMTYAGQADEPMSEFWSWDKFGAAYSCTEMASAAHVYGKPILGAEAFTATDGEKWLGHPAYIKDLGDWAFCEGINRFVFHRYAMQPWTNPNRAPGMSMGPWGLHYERTQTWWEQSRAWHEYLARCQYLLQQGLFVADVCYLQPEGAPRRFAPPPTAMIAPFVRGGYNFDGCTPEVVLTRMSVKDGRIVLPDGMSYRLLVLPLVETMTPALLGKIKELVAAGATVVAPWRSLKAPGLSRYPACDEEVRTLAADLWGADAAPAEVSERRVGQGRIIWGGELSPKPTAVPSEQPEFGSAQWIWHKEGNPALSAPPGVRYFRRIVTLPSDSRIASARLVMTADNEFVCYINGRNVGTGNDFHRAYFMNVASALKPGENLVAVMATNTTDSPSPAGLIGMLSVKLGDGGTLAVPTDPSWETCVKAARGWNTSPKPAEGWAAALQLGPLGMAPWGQIEAAPAAEEAFPAVKAVHQWLAKEGLPPDFRADRLLRYIHRRIGGADVYFVANGSTEGLDALCSFRIAGKQPELWHPESGNISPLAAYKEKDGCTHLPLRLGPTESVFVVFRRPAEAAGRLVSATRDGQELLRTAPPAAAAKAAADIAALDLVRGEICQPGSYVFKTADGRSRKVDCRRLAAPLPIGGPWEVAFDPNWGGPAKAIFEKLDDWSKRAEEGIKHYSGAATYRTTFNLDADGLKQPDTRWYLDLGKVAVMAEVCVNGKQLGIVWKTPYRLDVTGALKPGDNILDVKVVNLWINRQIGDEELPDDCDRNANGTLKSWPKWLQEGKPSPAGRYTFSSWKLWKKGDRLQESGLLGPVTLRPALRIER